MKPMLFNTEMVRAILDGRKTCTRRVAFPNGDLREFPRPDNPDAWWFRGRAYKNWDSAMVSPQGVLSLCKYKKGGILYVRETWKRADGRYFYCADFDSDFLDPCETISGGYPDSCRYYPECIGAPR